MTTEQFNLEFENQLERVKGKSPVELSCDEEFWTTLRKGYLTEEKFINLNNGGVSPQSLPVRDAFISKYEMSNKGPTWYMWKVLEQVREPLRAELAEFINAAPDEVCITRNTTESLGQVIHGITLNAGDEVVLSKYDYPNMIYAWKQRELREKIKLVWLDFELPEEEPDKIIENYKRHFTSKTKVVLLPHIVNWTGQVLPVKQICQEARNRGILSMVDGAHSFANLEIDVKDLGCDYFGTSLHKWLGSPFGTGLLYIRKEQIAPTYAIFPNESPESDNIRKFEWQGTRTFPAEYSISEALAVHKRIGTANKRARLLYLRDYWMDKVKHLSEIHYLSPRNPALSSNLVTFSNDVFTPEILEQRLLDKGVITASFNWEKAKGIRITPHVYTKPSELDQFAKVLEEILQTCSEGAA